MQNANRRFHDTTVDKTKKSFFEFLGAPNLWFGELLYGIHEGYIQNGRSITEILVCENMEVRVSILKSYIPCHCKDGANEGELFMPNKVQILAAVDQFVEYTKDPENAKTDLYGRSIDFSFQVYGLGIFRVNFSHGNEGCSLSMRYLPFDVPSLELVGYPEMYRKFFSSIIQPVSITTPPVCSDDFYISVGGYKQAASFKNPVLDGLPLFVPKAGGGLVIHIGATSSGKTTAMGSEIAALANKTSGLILTYEDPVEFIHVSTLAPVQSFEIGRDLRANSDFTQSEVIQRHALRRNPSVIMFGELRTKEQMRLAVDLSNRGHWVFASMHGNDCFEGISVLAAIYKDEPYLLANALKCAISHRLSTTSDGKIFPLFEIYIPDTSGKKHLADGKPGEIKNLMNKKFKDNYCSFYDSLDHMISTNRVLFSEKEAIASSVLGIDLSQKEEEVK